MHTHLLIHYHLLSPDSGILSAFRAGTRLRARNQPPQQTLGGKNAELLPASQLHSIVDFKMSEGVLFEDFHPSEELIALLRDFTHECLSLRVPPNKLVSFAKTCAILLTLFHTNFQLFIPYIVFVQLFHRNGGRHPANARCKVARTW